MDFDLIETKATLLAEDLTVAKEVRETLRRSGTFFVNVMASPGAGKTTLLLQTVEKLKNELRIGVMEADADGDVDARTLSDAGVRTIQIHTGGSCHMDARMTLDGLKTLKTDDLDLVFLENIGNLVCPAEFDTGADLNLVILSVPEGDDKPLKYPLMFSVADQILINKTDVKEVFDFDDDRFEKAVRTRNNHAKILFVSALTGDGIERWIEELKGEMERSGKRV